jgi:RHS repeat-associated protein
MQASNRMLKLWYLVPTLTVTTVCQSQQLSPLPYSYEVKVNYVRVWDAVAPLDSNIHMINGNVQQVRQSTQYLDGLGRPLQTVSRWGSMVTGDSARDLVIAQVYDALGREQVKYLPFAADSTGGNASISDGRFKFNPFQQDSVFSKGQYPGENFYYGKTVFESSPLSRVFETYAAGDSWVGTASQGSEANRRGVKAKYWINTATDSVRQWNITELSGSLPTISSAGVYHADQLLKTVMQDEHNNQVIEFKDKEEKVILKKVQLTAAADGGTGKGHYGWLCTYYIYDELGQLAVVIQPEGVQQLAANSWSVTTSLLKEQSFRYLYDHRGRIIQKQVPGAGPVHMVYDARDRLVLNQDSMLRKSGKWMYTRYDELNRPVATGLWTTSTDIYYHTPRADTSAAYPNLTGQAIEELTKIFYDDYNWLSGESNPLPATRSNTDDGYFMATSNTVWPYAQNSTSVSNQIKGMITGTKTNVLGTSTFLYTVSFYDEKGRLIQLHSTNITGGTDVLTTQYSWSGQPLVTIARHQKSGGNAQSTVVVTRMTYDDLGRLLKTEKKVSNTLVASGTMPASYTTLSAHKYNALGQLTTKKLAPAYNSDEGLESMNYEYNIREWMLGANRAYVKDTSSTSHWFGFDLGYDKTTFTVTGGNHSYAAAQFSGNINGMLWRSTGDDRLRKYDFTYDAANRFLSADFNQYGNSSFSKNAGVDFSVSGMRYDGNGNILSMKQRGLQLASSITIDSLQYNYYSGTNQLLNVIDGRNEADTRFGDFRTSSLHPSSGSKNSTTTDYTYDGNGNMLKDINKDIVSYTGAEGIEYNHLNLPQKITVKKDGSSNKGTIEYVYDALGIKLKKIVYEPGVDTTVTLYLAGNYINDTLQFIATEEGRLRYKERDDTLYYDYFVKDHLGNVRMLLTEEQQTDMYPFASLETDSLATERIFYGGVDTGRVNKSAINDYPSDPDTDPNDFVQRLKGNGPKLGSNILLKVMAGDRFNVRATSWWKSDDTPSSPISPLNDILNTLNAAIPVASSGKVTEGELSSGNILSSAASGFLNSHSGYTSGRPKAFVNWALFDEQFHYVANGSGFEQVDAKNTLKRHNLSDIDIPKNGYLYIYVSNETPNIEVFFDNLQVTHVRGPLLEETHYYPFGLTMAGISSKAYRDFAGNNKKFTRQDFDEDFGINLYQMRFRSYDPQIGKFIQIDPLAHSFTSSSPFTYAENDVIRSIDYEGLEKVIITNDRVNDHIFSSSYEAVYRNGEPMDNNLVFSKPPNYQPQKDVLRIHNGTTVQNNSKALEETNSIASFENFIKKNGLVQRDVFTDATKPIQIEIHDYDDNSVIGIGDVFNKTGDTYYKSEGFASGVFHNSRNALDAANRVSEQVTELSNAVTGLDMKNFFIALNGNKSDQKKLEMLKTELSKQYGSSVTINIGYWKPNEEHKQGDRFIVNATIAAVKDK